MNPGLLEMARKGMIAEAINDAAPSIGNAADTLLVYNRVINDTFGGFSNGMFNAPVTGWYFLHCVPWFTANATGTRYGQIVISGGSGVQITAASGPATASKATPLPMTALTFLLAGQQALVQVWQNSGAGLAILASPPARFMIGLLQRD